jgi:transcriptional regulator with XRE-family HTH domain
MSDSFGALLRRHRHAVELTMEELAEASGVSARAISDMERARSRTPQRRTVQALADALALAETDQAAFFAAAKGRRRPVSPAPAGCCALPRPVPDFTGRDEELHCLARIAASAEPTAVIAPVVTVSGAAGLGKTTLVVQAAHLLDERFPGGTFFVDLRGMDPRPLNPDEVVGRLLTAFGVGGDAMPPHVEDRYGLYRDLLRHRRALIVLDNAADEAQVRPLLPGGGPALTVITSRRLLAGLEGVHRHHLAQLSAQEAVTLLRHIIRDREPGPEPGVIEEIAELCGRLPLALRIAGNRLLSRPEWTARHLAGRLADESRRLDQLIAGDLRIGVAFNLSYTQLSPTARRLFRRLSLIPGADFNAALAGVVGSMGAQETEDALDELVEVSLLDPAPDGRYLCHDLLRLFARERLCAEEPAEEHEAARLRLGDRLPAPPAGPVVAGTERSRHEVVRWLGVARPAAPVRHATPSRLLDRRPVPAHQQTA